MISNLMAFFPTNINFQNQNEEPDPSHSLSPIFPSCTPQDFHGVTSIFGKRSMSFSGIDMCEETNGDDDLSDDCLQVGEKKRRLNLEQVKTLEKNFELGNKLEPERKMQLARALGLQPRQIAIWFQNRRARWKTKQLEKDYDVLKRQFDAVKAENDVLQSHNKKLQEEILALKSRQTAEPINLNKETEASCSNLSENNYDINLDISKTVAMDTPLSTHPRRSMFQSLRPANMVQFLQTTSRPDIQCSKIEHDIHVDNFNSMLCPVQDQPNFWPWQDPQNFH